MKKKEKINWKNPDYDKLEKPKTKVYVGCHADYTKSKAENPYPRDKAHVLGAESIAIEIEGDFEFISANGKREIITDGKISLCTCGQSKNKPFCDQSHQKVYNPIKNRTDVWDSMNAYERIQTLLEVKDGQLNDSLKQPKEKKIPTPELQELGDEITKEMLD
jgi:CDGSH-type Zn-finger protein